MAAHKKDLIRLKFTINNVSSYDLSELEGTINEFFPYAQERLGFDKPVSLNLVSDMENSKDPFGKTAYYDPNKMEITLFVDKRHVKDVLRSFSHELVHHAQHCRGEFDDIDDTEQGYAQKDPHMRKMEAEAYLLGNGFLVRDYEDLKKEKRSMSEQKHNLRENQALVERISAAVAKALDERRLEKDKVKGGEGLNRIREEEELEEGGAAARTGNEDRDQGRDRMLADRVHENEELEEEEEVVEERLDHPGQECSEAHSGKTHDEYQQEQRQGGQIGKVNESFVEKKNNMLYEKLVSKWCK